MKRHFLLLAIAPILGACSKDKSGTVSPKTTMLTASKWRLTARTMTSTSYGVTTVETTIQPCEVDDFQQFSPDKTFVRDEGATKCGTTSLQVLLGTWRFNSDETKLLTILSTSPNNETESIIKELTSTTLHLFTTSQGKNFTSTSDNTYTAF